MLQLLSLQNGGPRKISEFLKSSHYILLLFCNVASPRRIACYAIQHGIPGNLDQFCVRRGKPQLNPSTVILKMETGFVPYLVKLVKQDSCSLIKYNCILLLPWWVWVWVGFFMAWTPKMEMPKATPKKLCCYFTVLVPNQNRLGWGCRNVVILIVKPLEFTDSECH